MRKFLIAAVAVTGLSLAGTSLFAASGDKGKEINGVLIDNACGGKMDNQEAAAKHPMSCTTKAGCEKSGYQVVSGDKHLKFDDKGNELAKEYLKVKDHSTSVVVMGTPSEDGKSIKVTSIKPGKGDAGKSGGDSKKEDH